MLVWIRPDPGGRSGYVLRQVRFEKGTDEKSSVVHVLREDHIKGRLTPDFPPGEQCLCEQRCDAGQDVLAHGEGEDVGVDDRLNHPLSVVSVHRVDSHDVKILTLLFVHGPYHIGVGPVE